MRAVRASRHREIEVKVRLAHTPRTVVRSLLAAGFGLRSRRAHESNVLYDFPDDRLRRSGCALRIRRYGNTSLFTFKGRKSVRNGIKSREEIETQIADAAVLETVIRRIGMIPAFRYEKYRTTYARGALLAMIDETPIGDFMEIEGAAAEIDAACRELGIPKEARIRETYIELFRREHRGDMLFAARRAQKRQRK